MEHFSSINFENPLYFWRMRRKQKTMQENSENWGNLFFYILEWHIFWAEWFDAFHAKWDTLMPILGYTLEIGAKLFSTLIYNLGCLHNTVFIFDNLEKHCILNSKTLERFCWVLAFPFFLFDLGVDIIYCYWSCYSLVLKPSCFYSSTNVHNIRG